MKQRYDLILLLLLLLLLSFAMENIAQSSPYSGALFLGHFPAWELRFILPTAVFAAAFAGVICSMGAQFLAMLRSGPTADGLRRRQMQICGLSAWASWPFLAVLLVQLPLIFRSEATGGLYPPTAEHLKQLLYAAFLLSIAQRILDNRLGRANRYLSPLFGLAGIILGCYFYAGDVCSFLSLGLLLPPALLILYLPREEATACNKTLLFGILAFVYSSVTAALMRDYLPAEPSPSQQLALPALVALAAALYYILPAAKRSLPILRALAAICLGAALLYNGKLFLDLLPAGKNALPFAACYGIALLGMAALLFLFGSRRGRKQQNSPERK